MTPEASDWDDIDAVPWGGTDRPTGWLDDLGAPSVYFVNMAGPVTPDETEVVLELAREGARIAGVVLDMRDYPELHIYEFARNFNDAHFILWPDSGRLCKKPRK